MDDYENDMGDNDFGGGGQDFSPSMGMPQTGGSMQSGGGFQKASHDVGDLSTMISTNDGLDDWPAKAIQPDSPGKWHSNTVASLNLAKELTRRAMHQVNDNEETVNDKAFKKQMEIVHGRLKTKISNTTDLAKALEDRIESCEDTIRQTGECLFQLQRCHRSKWSPLNVCERRLEMRDSRPLQELVRDHCQQQLENERQTHIEARQELADQIHATKEMLTTLEALKNELIEDLQHKRHALRIDRSCLHPDKPHAKEPDRVFLPALPEVANYTLPQSPKAQERGTGGENEGGRQKDTRTLIQKALRVEEDSMRLCNENDAAMLHTKRECTRASGLAVNSFQKHKQETDSLRKALERQVAEMSSAIDAAERSLVKTKKKIDSHEGPLRVLNKQYNLRDRRTDREGIRDQVGDEMEGHLELVKSNVKLLTGKWEATKKLVETLKSTKQQMTDDLKGKMLAMRIDDSCIKVTPRKAIELDRLDPRGGRVRDISGKSKVRMNDLNAIVDDEFV